MVEFTAMTAFPPTLSMIIIGLASPDIGISVNVYFVMHHLYLDEMKFHGIGPTDVLCTSVQ